MRLFTARKSDDAGFTLIELLVVMIIIGVLASIAIPTFIAQRRKAEDAAARADVSTLGKSIATYWIDSTVMPTITATGGHWIVGGETVGNISANVELGFFSGTTDRDWCVAVLNANGDISHTHGFQYAAASGLTRGDCS